MIPTKRRWGTRRNSAYQAWTIICLVWYFFRVNLSSSRAHEFSHCHNEEIRGWYYNLTIWFVDKTNSDIRTDKLLTPFGVCGRSAALFDKIILSTISKKCSLIEDGFKLSVLYWHTNDVLKCSKLCSEITRYARVSIWVLTSSGVGKYEDRQLKTIFDLLNIYIY